MSSRHSSIPVDAGLHLGERGRPPGRPALAVKAMTAGAADEAKSAGETESSRVKLPASARAAMSRVAEAEAPDLQSSRELTGPMITLAILVLAWSLPAPSAGTLGFVGLCFSLALVEHHRARMRFRREVTEAGKRHGAHAQEAARVAQGMAEARFPEGRPAVRALDR
jgi:hypothetical protein